MRKCKTYFLTLLGCLLISSSIFADGTATLDWHWTTNEEVSYFRYRLSSDPDWIYASSDVRGFSLSEFETDKEYSLLLESSFDGLNWSETAMQTKLIPSPIVPGSPTLSSVKRSDGYEESKTEEDSKVPDHGFSLRISVSPYSVGLFDFFNGHDIEGARYLTHTSYGFSAGVGVGYYFANILQLSLNYDYSAFLKKESLIPDQEFIQYHKLYLGFDFPVIYREVFSLSIGFSAGAQFGLNAEYYEILPLLGTKISLGWHINDIFSIGFSAGASFSYAHDEDPLYKSLTYLVDTVSVFTEMRF